MLNSAQWLYEPEIYRNRKRGRYVENITVPLTNGAGDTALTLKLHALPEIPRITASSATILHPNGRKNNKWILTPMVEWRFPYKFFIKKSVILANKMVRAAASSMW
jgi:hypothetical protein